MPRGGQRKGAGRRSTWASGCKFADTKIVRVPAYIADDVLEFAHKLDASRYNEIVTNSKDEEELPIFKALNARVLLPPVSESALSVKRLGLQRAVLGRRRREFTDKKTGEVDEMQLSNFTQKEDPDSIAWKCQPKLSGDVGFDYVPLDLSDSQYQSLLQWMREHRLIVE